MVEALIPSVFTIVVVAVVMIILVMIRFGAIQVPQAQEWTIERFGKYNRTVQPGLHLIIPFVDKVGSKMSSLDRGSDDTAVGT